MFCLTQSLTKVKIKKKKRFSVAVFEVKRTILEFCFDYLNKAQVENSKSALRLLTHNMAVIQPSFTMHGQMEYVPKITIFMPK